MPVFHPFLVWNRRYSIFGRRNWKLIMEEDLCSNWRRKKYFDILEVLVNMWFFPFFEFFYIPVFWIFSPTVGNFPECIDCSHNFWMFRFQSGTFFSISAPFCICEILWNSSFNHFHLSFAYKQFTSSFGLRNKTEAFKISLRNMTEVNMKVEFTSYVNLSE